MTIADLPKLKPGDSFQRMGAVQTIKRVGIVRLFKDVGVDNKGVGACGYGRSRRYFEKFGRTLKTS